MVNPDQLDLFAQTPPPPALPTRPTCSLCDRPAYWRPVLREWARYCTASACDNPIRVCKGCGQSYDRFRPAGGTRYCSAECRERYYRSTGQIDQHAETGVCPVDGNPHKSRNQWRLCPNCYDRLQPLRTQLQRHHVKTELVVALLIDSTCALPSCQVDLLSKIRDVQRGIMRSPLAVDHDHACCPGPISCGECVRGLVCQHHNLAIGQLHDSVAEAMDLAAYLQTWQMRSAGPMATPPARA